MRIHNRHHLISYPIGTFSRLWLFLLGPCKDNLKMTPHLLSCLKDAWGPMVVSRKVITDTMKDLILEGNPPICLGCGLILTETPTFKLWLISTVVPLVLSMGILILSSLTHALCGSPWKGPWTCWSLWKSSKISLFPVSPPRRPLQHLAGSDLWPHSCLFFLVSVSPVPTQGLQLGSTLLLTLTSLDLPPHWAASWPQTDIALPQRERGHLHGPSHNICRGLTSPVWAALIAQTCNPRALMTGSRSSLSKAELRKCF